jgi:hypothetical protein
MTEQYPFTWRHYEADSILLCVRWYFRYPLSDRHLEELLHERACASITPPSTVGSNRTPQNWTSAAAAPESHDRLLARR